jgi:hypothetical protein
MDREMMKKRPANLATTLVMPKPVGTVTVRGRTRKETLAKVGKLAKRGYVAGASEIAQYHARAGGGYGVKVHLTKPLPQPIPSWAKGCAIVGSVLIGLALAGAVLVNALASLVGAAAALPWALIAGGAVVFLFVLAVVKRLVFGGGVTINQTVNM